MRLFLFHFLFNDSFSIAAPLFCSFALSLLSSELPYYHCGHRVRESFYLHILTNLPDDSKSRCERTYPLHSDQMIQLTRIQFRMEKVHGHPIKCTTDFCILIFVTIVRFVVVHLFLWISWVDIPSCFFLVISILSFFQPLTLLLNAYNRNGAKQSNQV